MNENKAKLAILFGFCFVLPCLMIATPVIIWIYEHDLGKADEEISSLKQEIQAISNERNLYVKAAEGFQVAYQEEKDRKARTCTIWSSAYNSLAGQTDDTPCIAARNFNICKHGKEDIIAANFLPLGTQVSINDKIYTVRDRMNRRYNTDRIDFWMKNYSDAISHGVQEVEMTILYIPGKDPEYNQITSDQI